MKITGQEDARLTGALTPGCGEDVTSVGTEDPVLMKTNVKRNLVACRWHSLCVFHEMQSLEERKRVA